MKTKTHRFPLSVQHDTKELSMFRVFRPFPNDFDAIARPLVRTNSAQNNDTRPMMLYEVEELTAHGLCSIKMHVPMLKEVLEQRLLQKESLVDRD